MAASPGSAMAPDADDLARLRREYADRERRFAGSDTYSLFNPGHLYMLQARERAVLQLLRRHGFADLRDRRVLELGCGRGGVLLEHLRYGAAPSRLHGTDLLPDRVAEARKLLPHLPLTCSDGRNLPYADGSFDLVLQYTVFSSALDDDVKAALAREMLRVLRPDGLIVWYDFWLNPTNRQTRGIRPAEIRRLFPDCQHEFHRVTVAPPIARRLAPRSWLACHLIESLRLLNTHYVAGTRRHASGQGCHIDI